MRLALWPLAALVLAGCDALPGLGAGFGRAANGPVQSLALYDGAVRAAGPEDYCIDTGLSRPARGFAVMAGCATLAGADRAPAIEGLITIQVGASGSATVAGNEAAMAALMRTAPGVALLSETGQPETIRIDAISSQSGLVVVHFIDASGAQIGGLEAAEWRAFLDVGPHLATIRLRGFDRAPLDRDRGLQLLTRAVDALRAANEAGDGDDSGG